MPDDPKNFLWLAVYNVSSLTIEKCQVLKGRKVFLFPDLNAYDNWSIKAKQFAIDMPETTFDISDLLERNAMAEEKSKGLEIADYLLRFDPKAFQNYDIKKTFELVSILIDQILSIPTETVTGSDFEKMSIVWFKTVNGSYDVLFDTEGEPVKDVTASVKRLAAFFNKDFKSGFIDNLECLLHVNN